MNLCLRFITVHFPERLQNKFGIHMLFFQRFLLCSAYCIPLKLLS